MEKSRKIVLGVLIAGGGLGALLSLRSPSSPHSAGPSTAAPQEGVSAPFDPLAEDPSIQEPALPAEAVSPAPDLSAGAAAVPVVDSAKQEESRRLIFSSYAFKDQMKQYELLAKKVLRPEAESAWLKKVQGDPQFVDSLTDLLTTPAQNSDEQSLQDAAIHVLVESVKSDPQGPAAQALNEIVSHPKVEDKSIPQPQRENLAGVKGELMMKWISSVPAEENSMAQRLPGPVSQKVWQNVLAIKENNLKESRNLPK